MNQAQTIQSNFQIKLIALGLLFIIPITINLGINFLYPAITWQDFENTKENFLKKNIPNFDHDIYQKYKYAYPYEYEQNWDIYKEEIKKWENSQECEILKTKQNQQKKFKYLVILFFITSLTISLYYINIPILKCSILGTITYLLFEIKYARPYYHSPVIQEYFLGIPIEAIELIIVGICLIFITYCAYQDQNL